jgi:hypothetical protein
VEAPLPQSSEEEAIVELDDAVLEEDDEPPELVSDSVTADRQTQDSLAPVRMQDLQAGLEPEQSTLPRAAGRGLAAGVNIGAFVAGGLVMLCMTRLTTAPSRNSACVEAPSPPSVLGQVSEPKPGAAPEGASSDPPPAVEGAPRASDGPDAALFRDAQADTGLDAGRLAKPTPRRVRRRAPVVYKPPTAAFSD